MAGQGALGEDSSLLAGNLRRAASRTSTAAGVRAGGIHIDTDDDNQLPRSVEPIKLRLIQPPHYVCRYPFTITDPTQRRLCYGMAVLGILCDRGLFPQGLLLYDMAEGPVIDLWLSLQLCRFAQKLHHIRLACRGTGVEGLINPTSIPPACPGLRPVESACGT